jgi:hypothetical protein
MCLRLAVLRGVARLISLYVCVWCSFLRVLFCVFSITVIVSQHIFDWFVLILHLAVFVYANQSPRGIPTSQTRRPKRPKAKV